MRCCSNSVIFIVASLTIYESLGAQIDLVNNNGNLTAGSLAKFICTWQDTEEVGSNQVSWNLPNVIYVYTYRTQKNRTCDGSLSHHNSLGVGYHQVEWITAVSCLNGSALSLTIDNISEDDNAIRIACKSRSPSFRSTWYKFDFPTAFPQANLSSLSDDVAGYVTAGTNVTLLCTWEPGAQDAYFFRWNWKDVDGQYLSDQSFYSYNYAIPNRTCEGGHLSEWGPKSVSSYPLKGRTSVTCIDETSTYLHIENVSAEDDGVAINCWGITFDASYTLHVYWDHCASQPCLNMGKCINDGISFHCDCLTGFKGPDCSKMKLWLPVTIGAAIVLLIILIILLSIKFKMLLYPRLQGAVRSDSILSNVHTPYMELGSI